MLFRLTNLKIDIDRSSALLSEIARKLSVPVGDILEYNVIKKATDARKKERIFFVYTVDVKLSAKGSKMVSRRKIPGLTLREPDAEIMLVPGSESLQARPVIVGAGPAGIFAALTLAIHGYRPIVLERGSDVDSRTRDVEEFWQNRLLNTESNVQFGEGGAGTFSDGKLTTRINDVRIRHVLKEFVDAGAPEEILYLNKPHIGTDILRRVVKNLRIRLQELGGEIYFGSKVTDLIIEQGKLKGVIVNEGRQIPAEVLVLAVGHSARDTYEMLVKRGLQLEAKALSIGVRIEHPQDVIDTAQYGQFAGHPELGAADYQLVYKNSALDRAAYSFCMCPGGRVVAAASEENTVVTNGMSDFARDSGVANSAVVVSVNPDDFGTGALAGMEFQRKIEKSAFDLGGRNYHAPAQLVGDFLAGRASGDLSDNPLSTYMPEVQGADLHQCLPGYVTKMLEEAIGDFDRKLKGFGMAEAVMTGVETRTSAPVRMPRNDERTASGFEGIYPAGEGAGYAGGIMSAAVDGIKAAEAIIQRYRKGV